MDTTATGRTAIVGAGRLGSALAATLHLGAPLGRGADTGAYDCVLLCVPDAQIPAAAAAIAPRDGLLVGHCSGATTLAALAPHEAFSMHPLMTVTGPGAVFAGAGGAIAGSTPRALAAAAALATALGLRVAPVADADRPAYHAAASLAANYLLAVEDAAERLFPADRALLVPLVRAAVEAWAAGGARAALTGPVVRGDEATVAAQRAAVADRSPADLPLFDVLTDATRALAARPGEGAIA